MSIKIQYNKQLLEKLCLRDECIVNFTKIKKYNRDIKVDFICKCGNTHNKTFRGINNFGGFCKICTNNNKQNKFKEIYFKKTGYENPFQNPEIQEQLKETYLKKFGVEHPMQNPEIKNKIRQTCIEKFGVEHPSQSQEIKDKKIETCIKNFEVENPFQSQEIKNKIRQTCIEKFGVEHPMQNTEIKNKIRQTCIERYNTEHPMQNTEIFEKALKNSYNMKEFTFPCSNIIQVQGYEPFLLDILVKEGYTFEDIIVKVTDVPKICYEKNNKEHRYFCDIYIPKTNTIYEVKSTWTYKQNIEVNLLKKQACIDAGYNFELWIFDTKGNRINKVIL